MITDPPLAARGLDDEEGWLSAVEPFGTLTGFVLRSGTVLLTLLRELKFGAATRPDLSDSVVIIVVDAAEGGGGKLGVGVAFFR